MPNLNWRNFPEDTTGLHYALRILVGTTALWFLLQYWEDTNPLWAVISMIAVTETQISATWLNFHTRLLHTLVGCIVGLLSLGALHNANWVLPVGLSVTVLISNYIIRVPQGWRVAPITTALIISAGMQSATYWQNLFYALHRTGEVLLGSAMALLITWLASHIWHEKQITPQ